VDTAWLQARITATQTQIEAYEAAILAVSSGTVQSWSLDTGQTKETVTKKNIAAYEATLERLYNRLAVLEARLNGAGTQVRPAW
jgi:uncharacterized iron-regulated protein